MARTPNITFPVTVTPRVARPASTSTDEDSVRDALRFAGLLPDPSGSLLSAGVIGRNRQLLQRLAELERVIRNLSCDLSEARLDVARLQNDRYHQATKIDQVVEAFEWLRDSYDLDRIALDVIEHAIFTARSDALTSI